MSKNFLKTEKEITNKKGVVIERIMNLQPKKGFVSIHEINNMYKKMIQTADIDPHKIMIKVVAFDGFKTIKSYDHTGDDLEMTYDEYYRSLPKETRDKFSNLLAFQIITRPH